MHACPVHLLFFLAVNFGTDGNVSEALCLQAYLIGAEANAHYLQDVLQANMHRLLKVVAL